MTYSCSKRMYDSIYDSVTSKDLRGTKLSAHGWVMNYINSWLNLPDNTITEITFK